MFHRLPIESAPRAATLALAAAAGVRMCGCGGETGRGGGRQVGVDMNLAVDRQHVHGHTLQFVSGLGPRKAAELLQVPPLPSPCKPGCGPGRGPVSKRETMKRYGQALTLGRGQGMARCRSA